MNVFGFIMIAVGCFFFICGMTKSEFIVYRILVSRSETLWQKKVHGFYTVVGIAIIVVGALMAMGLIKR